eukprot:NODE_124_length_17341_cov_0.560028.p11 type:complete len:183 gc:universal NODE_124_length_17341_cov_0.560028:12161-11613(-)
MKWSKMSLIAILVFEINQVYFYISNDDAKIAKVTIFKSASILGRPIIGSIKALHDFCCNIEISVETEETHVDGRLGKKTWNSVFFTGMNQYKNIFTVQIPPQATSGFESKQIKLAWFLKVKIEIPTELSLGLEEEKSNDLVAIFKPHKRTLRTLESRIPISVFPSKLHSQCLPKIYQLSYKL